MNYYKKISIHVNKISTKKYRIEISRNYIADQTMRLYYKIIENVKKTFNIKHFISLIQKEKLTCSAEKIITRKSRISHHNSQKFTVSEITSSLTTDRNAKHRFF